MVWGNLGSKDLMIGAKLHYLYGKIKSQSYEASSPVRTLYQLYATSAVLIMFFSFEAILFLVRMHHQFSTKFIREGLKKRITRLSCFNVKTNCFIYR